MENNEGTHEDTPQVTETAQEPDPGPEMPTTLKELMSKDDDVAEEAALVASMIDSEGNLRAAFLEIPDEFTVEIMATQLIEHLSAYHQQREAWKAAKNSGDQARSKQLFDSWNFQRLAAAILQVDHPGAKEIADFLMKDRAENARKARADKAAKAQKPSE